MLPVRFSNFSLRFWIGLSIVLMVICLILVMTLSEMAPRVVVLPQLISKDTMRFDQFVEVTNLKAPVKERKLIDEMLIRFYVENRHFYIPDIAEMSYRYGRWGPVGRMSAPNVYGAFMKSKGNYLENIRNETATKMADITSVTRRDNTFTVDFDVYSLDHERRAFAGSRRATIEVGYNPRMSDRLKFAKDFANPYGLYIKIYEESGLKKR